MTNLPVAHASDPNVPMRGPFTTSFMLHCGVFLAINALAWLNVQSVHRQSEAFVDRIEKKEKRDAELARKEQRDGAKEAVKNQLAMEMANIVAADVHSPDLDRIMAATTGSISDLFQDVDLGEDGGDGKDLDQERMAALEKVESSADQLLREALVTQVRQFVRDQVAPEIKERIAKELKNRTGDELEKTFEGKLKEDKSERLRKQAGELRKQAGELGKQKQEIDQAKGESERGEAKQASERTDKARGAVAQTEKAASAAASDAAANEPGLAKEAEAAKDAKDESSALDKAAASAGGEKQQASTDLSAAGQAIEARAQALGKLAQQLEERAANPQGVDTVESRTAAAAKGKLDPAVRDAVAKEITEKAIPDATGKIMGAVGNDLAKLGIKQDEFAGLLKQDIANALAEGVAKSDPPSSDAAWKRTDDALGLDDSKDLAATRDALTSAAEKLAGLAKRQDEIKATTDEQAPKETGLSDDISKVERGAKDALTKTRSESVTTDAQVDQSIDKLRRQSATDSSAQAATASKSGNATDAGKLMDDTARTLRESSAQLTAIAGALDQEIAAASAKNEKLAEMAKGAMKEMKGGAMPDGPMVSGAAVDGMVAAGKQMLAGSVGASVGAAMGQFQPGSVLGDAARLSQLKSLKESLAQAKKNVSEGRGTGSPTLFAAPGGGAGKPVGNGARGKAKIASFNREAYESFVKDLRNRTTPGNAYTEIAEVTGLDSVAEAERGPFPAVVYAPSAQPAAAVKPGAEPAKAERTVPEPTYKHIAFGAAAMVTQPITIDGDLSDWGELTHPMAMQYGTTDANAKIANGTKVYMRWSNEGIYLGYVVHDDGGIQLPSAKSPYLGDCLEFFLDMENGRREAMTQSQFSHQFIFTPFGCVEDAKDTFTEIGRNARGLKIFQAYPDLERKRGWSAGKQIPGGYSVECFIRREALSKPVLVPGSYLAVNFSVNTAGAGVPDSQTQWSASKVINSWDKPDTWGDVLLLGSDATISALTMDGKPMERVVPGQAVQVEITDKDMDIDPTREDRVMATIGVKDSADQVVMVLKETGPGTGVFRGSVNTQLYLDEPVKNTVSLRPGDRLEIAYDDPRAAFGEEHRRVVAAVPVAHPVITLAKVSASVH